LSIYSDTLLCCLFFFFSSRRRHTRFSRDWSSDVCSSDLTLHASDQFVLRGGKLLVFIDPYSEADTGDGFPLDSIDRASGLEPLLAAWGVRMVPDKVLADAGYGMTVSMGQGRPVRHPAWVSLPAEALDQHDVVTADLA